MMLFGATRRTRLKTISSRDDENEKKWARFSPASLKAVVYSGVYYAACLKVRARGQERGRRNAIFPRGTRVEGPARMPSGSITRLSRSGIRASRTHVPARREADAPLFLFDPSDAGISSG